MLGIKQSVLFTAMAAVLGASSAFAYEKGDFIARAGWARVMPNVDSGQVGAIAGSEVDVQDSDSLGLTFDVLLTDNFGIGLLAAWPFNIDIEGAGSIASLGKIAEAKALPPTLTAKWFPNIGSRRIQPYAGIGLNYTLFWDEKGRGGTVTDVKLDDSLGLAAEAGVDFNLADNWLLSAQLWYVNMDTKAKTNVGDVNVNVDPWVFMLGVGTKF